MSPEQMTCEEVMEHLFTFLDRELDADFHAQIEHHLERCRDCFTRAEFEEKLRAKVAEAAAEPAPESLHRRVHALLNRF